MRIFHSLLALGVLLLAACGGGGQPSAGNASVGPASLAGTFSYYRDGSVNNPVSYGYAQDLDGDGLDEVLMVAFETQPNTPAAYSATAVRVFGWRAGVFTDLTAQWLPNGQHEVGGVGDVAFGDFDADGNLDVFLSAYTDMDHPVQAYALMNRGGVFDRVALGESTWQHGVASADVNQDGYADVVVAGYSDVPQYMGSPLGLVPYRGMVGASGVTLGDFLGDGTVQAVLVDADGQEGGRSGPNDTALYTLSVNDAAEQVGWTRVAALPRPRLVEDERHGSHDVRARTVDFDSDGRLDVVVFSYVFLSGEQDPESTHRSEIQFLRNMGGGVFEDVTGSVRVGYDTSAYPGYTPVFRDVNGDGRLDLFTSQPDFFASGRHRSTTLLLQQADGRFVDTARADLTEVVEGAGGQAVLARGPGGRWFLVREGAWRRDGLSRVWVHPVLSW